MGGICARPRDYALALEEGTPLACPRFWSAFFRPVHGHIVHTSRDVANNTGLGLPTASAAA